MELVLVRENLTAYRLPVVVRKLKRVLRSERRVSGKVGGKSRSSHIFVWVNGLL